MAGCRIARSRAGAGLRQRSPPCSASSRFALRSLVSTPSGSRRSAGETRGELVLFYRLAPIVFMGGSLVAHGGQNPIEAVKLGAAIVHGPHVFNFTDVYEALDGAGGAKQADNSEALVRQLGQLLGDP